MQTRRQILLGGGVLGVAAFAGGLFSWRPSGDVAEAAYEIVKSEDEWRRILTPGQFAVLRKEGTEPSYSSPLDNEKRNGIFNCAGCKLDLYSSKTKFDSGTGWPSFWKSLPGAVGTKADRSLFMVRTEVHCRRCGGHLGHIFNDGPAPTGKRHCINGIALTFRPV